MSLKMTCGSRRPDGKPGNLLTPPPDTQQSKVPYRSGLKLTIRRHNPLPPYGVQYYRRSERDREFPPLRPKLTQREWCLRYPLQESRSPHPDSTLHSLRVLDEMACEDGRGAQVVRCCLDEDESQVYVAKIYDAVYYDWPEDVTWLADQDYRREAAAYEELQYAGVDGQLVPKYFGSWTTDVVASAGSDVLRPVRIVLMEWIQGVSMWSLIDNDQFTTIPPQHRLDILAAAIEMYSQLIFHYVRHGDFCPRNILLVGSDLIHEMPRVVLIDFNRSTVTSYLHSKFPIYEEKIPPNPICFLWSTYDREFFHWIPKPHRSRDLVWRGWLKATWGNSQKFFLCDGEDRKRFETEEVEIVPPLPDAEPKDPSPSRHQAQFVHEQMTEKKKKEKKGKKIKRRAANVSTAAPDSSQVRL